MASLLTQEVLNRSDTVANCAMNRERGLSGPNSYARDLGFEPLEFLTRRLSGGRTAAWLDLCCGSGRALIEAGRRLRDAGRDGNALLGLDLVPMFLPVPPELNCVRFDTASLPGWEPDRQWDLITCVHGLHYIGDKLELVREACGWLNESGRFVAHLDPDNFRSSDGGSAGKEVLRAVRAAGLQYDGRRRLLSCSGPRYFQLPFRYLGADDRAGPNCTGQPAVHSYYTRAEAEDAGVG